jgi:signal transduction histidine kinase
MANPAATEATGTAVGALIGMRIFEAFPSLEGTPVAEAFLQVARSGKGIDLGEVHYGDERVADAHFAVKAFPLSDRSVGVAFENITRRKLMEEATERAKQAAVVANQELESFSYSVSHDLRAPLRSIDGFSLALLEDYEEKLDDTGKDYLRRVRAATQRMGRLIDDLLELARVTRSELKKQDVDLSAVAAEVVKDLRGAEPAREVEVAIAQGLKVKGDPALLRVALDNLLRNAWKFTGKKPRARIEIGRLNGSTLFVKDDGVGFDPAHAGKLFGAFQRLHAATEFPGTGIGLATVKRVVLRHGGRIWAESMPERGATFFFTLDSRSEP